LDKIDIEKIEKDAIRMENEGDNMKVMKWIVDHNFFSKFD